MLFKLYVLTIFATKLEFYKESFAFRSKYSRIEILLCDDNEFWIISYVFTATDTSINQNFDQKAKFSSLPL